MNWVEEKRRIQKILEEMPISEFEELLEKRGIGTIKESYDSDYVKCLRISKSNIYSNDAKSKMKFRWGNIDMFNIEDQGVA